LSLKNTGINETLIICTSKCQSTLWWYLNIHSGGLLWFPFSSPD